MKLVMGMADMYIKGSKGVKGGFSVVVGGSLGWSVDICVGSGISSYDKIIFSIDYRYNIGSSYEFFDDFDDDKPVVSFLDKLLG